MSDPGVPHILIVDDEPDVEALFRQKFRRRVRSGDFIFEFAENGQQGLEKLMANPQIGIVFTDVNMPVMDGLEFLGRMQAIKDRLLKTLVISAYGDMHNIRRAMNEGAMDFIVKPIDLVDLEKTLDKAVAEWQGIAAGKEAALALENERREKELAEETRRLQKQFFDNVTHELRTPLTLLLGPLETAVDHAENAEVIRALYQARKSGHTLLQLIDELLDVARIEAGSLSLELMQADLVAFLRDLVDSFSPLARTRGVDLTFSAANRALPLDFDPAKLRKVFSNLLSNGLKFTPSGGMVQVSIPDTADNNQVRILVQDNGPGIPAEDLPHIFERFYRASEGSATKVRGVGIGLSLTRELVHLHEGQITAYNEGGAQFEVILPHRQNAAPGHPGTAWILDAEPSPESTSISEDLPFSNPEQPLLLLVEDNAEIREFIRSSLAAHYRILEAENGAKGLEIAHSEVPDLVISDVMMPVMDGHEFCRQLKADTATSHVPVILLTAQAQAGSRVESLRTGADAYMTKPFEKVDLLATADNLINSRRLLRDKFRQEQLLVSKVDEPVSREDKFLQALRKSMDLHLADELFGVEQMASELNMSRKTLHRKVKAITGQTPNQFIRSFRLESAMQMLKSKSGLVGEVAFLNGFSSHSYFSKCFTEYFKVSPSEVE